LALSVLLSELERVPMAVGLKVTLMVQLFPGARLELQAFDWAKSPLTERLMMSRAVLPVLVRVTCFAALVV
jgi:hypothetical protein